MTREDFQNSRVEMTPSQYCEVYLSANDIESFGDAYKLFVYADGLYIQVHPGLKYHVIVSNQEYDFKDLSKAEDCLWNEFAKHELRFHYRKETILPSIETRQELGGYVTGLMRAMYYPKAFDDLDRIKHMMHDVMIDMEAEFQHFSVENGSNEELEIIKRFKKQIDDIWEQES